MVRYSEMCRAPTDFVFIGVCETLESVPGSALLDSNISTLLIKLREQIEIHE